MSLTNRQLAARPAADMREHDAEPPLHRGAETRIVKGQPPGHVVKVAQRFVGKDNRHALRSLVNTVDLLTGCEAAFACDAQAALDARKFGGRWLAVGVLQSGFDVERDIREFVWT